MVPDISVIIPVYNGKRHIADAVESALSQTGVNLEAVVVDDCPDGETPEIVQNLMKTDERLSYIRTLGSEGMAGARNIGVEAASGQWAAFLDAGDKWHSDKLFRQIELVRQYESVGKHPPLCYTGAYVMNGDGSFAGRVVKAPSRVSSHELLTGNIILSSTVMVRRECLLEYPFEQGDLDEDYIEWYRILANYGAGVGIGLPLVRHMPADSVKPVNKIKSAYTAWRTYRSLGLSTSQSLVSFAFFMRRGLLRYEG